MNIIDYCKWRGDLSFDKDPFNDVDNLVIAQMVYTPFEDVLNTNDVISIKDLSDLYFSKHTDEEIQKSKSFVSKAPYVLKAMALTKRFSDLKVHNFVCKFSEDKAEQFAALIIDLPGLTSVVCFRGTDDTTIGWKEDLMLSYTNVSAQKDAVDYINNHCHILRDYIVIGHSKGGHLALYASVNCNKLIQNKIKQVISNDGPGLMPGSYSEKEYDAIKSRYKKIVPEFDVFGTIYNRAENKQIVKSDAIGVMQHSAMVWQVEGNNFIKANQLSKFSFVIEEIINDFLDATTPIQRQMFIEDLFNKLCEDNIHNISEFQTGGLPVIIKALKSLSELNPNAKQIVEKAVEVISEIISEKLKEKAIDTYKHAEDIALDKYKYIERKAKKLIKKRNISNK